jgi:hypothetical protein
MVMVLIVMVVVMVVMVFATVMVLGSATTMCAHQGTSVSTSTALICSS